MVAIQEVAKHKRVRAFGCPALAALWLVFAGMMLSCRGVSAMSHPEDAAQPPAPIEQVYQQALAATGYRYLEHEAELQQRAAEALPFLRLRQAQATEAFDRFAASTLADWIQGDPKAEYMAVMEKLMQTDQQLSQTPAGGIRADIVESTMNRMAGKRLVAILALRLSANALSPPWLERGALQYLHRHRSQVLLPALERYVALSHDGSARTFARRTIAQIRGVAAD